MTTPPRVSLPALPLLLLWFAAASLDALPRFDPTSVMLNALIPADAAPGAPIYRLRASDPTFDYPLVFGMQGDTTIISIETLNCTRFNSLCSANVVLQRRLEPGRFYDFSVTATNPSGASTRTRCSFRATNATTPIGEIFPGAPSLLRISEAAKRNTELGTLIAKGNPLREKGVLLELWGSPLFGLRQRLITAKDAEGAIVLLGPLDYETQSSYHLTVLANDPWTERGNDTRNIASWPVLIAVVDEQDTPPVFTLAPPVTLLDAGVQPGDVVVQVRAEDGDRGNPRSIRYGLVSEGNPFVVFFNISEDSGELRLARPIAEIQAISHPGAHLILTVVAEEVRIGADEAPAQSSSAQIALILPTPTSTTLRFSKAVFTTNLDENSPQGTPLNVSDFQVVGDPGEVVTLELENNNGTFDVTPDVIEGTGRFKLIVRDAKLLDFERRRFVHCDVIAKQLKSTNNTARTHVVVFLNDINDNPPVFLQDVWRSSVLENSEAGTSILKVQATDADSNSRMRYTRLIGERSKDFRLDAYTGVVTVYNPEVLDAESNRQIQLTVEVADGDGRGLSSTSTIIIEVVDVNDEAPKFEHDVYEFILSPDRKSFTIPAFIKAVDLDVTPPNNEVHYELTQPTENITLHELSGEVRVRPIWKYTDVGTLRARAWDGGVPRLFGECEIRLYPPETRNRTVTFIVRDTTLSKKMIQERLEAITGSEVAIQHIKHINDEKGDSNQVVAIVYYGSKPIIDESRIENLFENRHFPTTTKEEIVESRIAWPWWLLLALFILLLIIALILILCCICPLCPLFIAPKKRKVGSVDHSRRLIADDASQTLENKGVQVAEWFGRREAWTPDHGDAEVESLRRHEMERGSDRGGQRKVVKISKEDPRDQLYIREGNTDILRLVTRGGEQRPVTLVADQGFLDDSGKEILLRRYIDQQQTQAASKTPANLPNEVQRSFDHEQLEATLRQQNVLLRQLLREREEFRLETQSLPAGTQTDRDAGTQTETQHLEPAKRRAVSDNDLSEGSDDEAYGRRKQRLGRYGRKKRNVTTRRQIKTPIQEESESTLELERQQRPSSIGLDRIRKEIIREIFTPSTKIKRPTKSAIRREVLKEIADSFLHSEESEDNRKVVFSEEVESSSSSRKKTEVKKSHSISDLRETLEETFSKESENVSQSTLDLSKRKSGTRLPKSGGSRYMEWYKKKEPAEGARVKRRSTKEGAGAKRKGLVDAELKGKKIDSTTTTSSSRGVSSGSPKHPLIQHSEHRFEPKSVIRRVEDDGDSGIALAKPPIAEKKSVFSIAYADIQRQTRQLRPESSTPPT